MSKDGFIARWSRLKGEAAAPAAPQPAAETVSEAAPVPPAAPPETPPPSAQEIAALPPLETLTAASDITPYLRKGVPALLRQGALRRMWTLNPAIRDYVDDAMEYAMDWNTPGAILGNGPLNVGDDAASMVRRLVGDKTPDEAVQTDAAQIDAADTPSTPPQELARDMPAPETARDETAHEVLAQDKAAPEPAQAERLAKPQPARRRHGGAAPT